MSRVPEAAFDPDSGWSRPGAGHARGLSQCPGGSEQESDSARAGSVRPPRPGSPRESGRPGCPSVQFLGPLQYLATGRDPELGPVALEALCPGLSGLPPSASPELLHVVIRPQGTRLAFWPDSC